MTPLGYQQQAQQHHVQAQLQALEKHHALHGEAQRQAEARASLTRTANVALYWGIGGLFGCLCFVPSVIALVMGFRARKMAKKYQLVLPLNATLGPVLGLLGILGGGFLVGLGVYSEQTRSAKLEELEARLGNLGELQLRHGTACDLVQRRVLSDGFLGSTHITDFECDGKLTQAGTSATLENVRLKAGSTKHTVRACLEYGARWSVVGFRKEVPCSQPDDTGATGTAAPSPTLK